MTPLTFGWWRAALGGVALLAIITARSRSGRGVVVPRGVTGRELALLVATTWFALMVTVGLFVAYQQMSVGIVLITFYTFPVMVAAVGFAFLGEPVDRAKLAALALAIAGMALVVGGGMGAGGELRIGALGLGFALAAAVGQAGFALLTRRGFQSVPSEHATGFVLAGITGALLVLVLAGGESVPFALPLAHPELLALVGFAGIFTSAGATTLFVRGIRMIGPLRAGIVALFEPVVGVVLAALLLGERLGPIELAGGLLVLVAAALIQRAPRDRGAETLAGGPVAPID